MSVIRPGAGTLVVASSRDLHVPEVPGARDAIRTENLLDQLITSAGPTRVSGGSRRTRSASSSRPLRATCLRRWQTDGFSAERTNETARVRQPVRWCHAVVGGLQEIDPTCPSCSDEGPTATKQPGQLEPGRYAARCGGGVQLRRRWAHWMATGVARAPKARGAVGWTVRSPEAYDTWRPWANDGVAGIRLR